MFGFNGKENDNEVKGEGNQQDYGMRIYDPRLGRFLSVDPLEKKYPWYSPYHFAGNSPIKNIDLDGGEPQDKAGQYQFGMMGNLFKNVAYGDDIVMNDPKLGYLNVRTVYDQTTKQVWFIASHPNNPSQLYYYNANDGNHQTLHVERNKGSKGMYTVTGGHFTPYLTPEQYDDMMRAKVANEFVDGFSSAIFLGGLAGAAAPALPGTLSALSSSYAGRGAINATIDAGSQLIANGGDINDLNLTSIGMSFALPDVKSFSGILLKNSISNGLQLNSGKGYQGFLGEGVNNTNVFINIGVGAILDKTSASLQNLNSGVTNATLGRWNNLSYKPKFAEKLQLFQRNQVIENIFKSPAGQAAVGTLSNLLSQKPN